MQAAELLKQAKGKYTAKDLMGAMKLYEDVLNQVGCCSALSPRSELRSRVLSS